MLFTQMYGGLCIRSFRKFYQQMLIGLTHMDAQQLLKVEECIKCIQIYTCILYSNLVVIDVGNHCYNFILSKIHYLGLICVPRSKVFLVESLCSSNFDICHVFVLYVKAQIVSWSVTKSHLLPHDNLFD
jgi:hypothetical protein